jgi:hypothetical protein
MANKTFHNLSGKSAAAIDCGRAGYNDLAVPGRNCISSIHIKDGYFLSLTSDSDASIGIVFAEGGNMFFGLLRFKHDTLTENTDQ